MTTKAEIIDKNEAIESLSDKRIAIVSGSFDLLHNGHFYLFEQAKKLIPENTKLVVIVMDDINIRNRKGSNRPILSLGERIYALTHIRNIDYILPWTTHWEELREFVLELKPNYYIVSNTDQGIDNKREHITKVGGELIVITRNPAYSTTTLLERIKNSTDQ
ncbi:adenylyltransferase/cytidyltransferase family protein [Candidatus Dojkabacteria bacterium]|uniref:Adenylyltransferase/cytidyltransferase family protein n=1 Tax=Candidatus Dojkabacteria bacterium TaxID=2099670 RepID=A0A952DVK7_9BACT|nr:adenylyltransferase/cytidyltransferase family protein [Candidatus Dojkabacteria bacterium]